MADVKWIKIVTDIFDDEKMLLIDGLPEHDAIIVIWFKLLCLAGKQNNGGVFTMNDKIAYTDEMLSTIFRRPLNTVRLALETFKHYEMIEIIDSVITIPNWNKHQTLDTYEKKLVRDRKYQAERRQKQRELLPRKSHDSRLTTGDESLSIAVLESEIDKEQELESDSEGEENTTAPQAEPKRSQCPYSKIRDLYHSICVSYPKINTIDGSRMKAIAARWRTYKSIDTFTELFRIAEASSFLKGQNDRNWSADFDWMMKPTNFTKILEHKYDERGSSDSKPTGVFGVLATMYEEADKNDGKRSS